MKLTLESTTKTLDIDGVPARIWEGHTEAGIPCHAYITRIAVDKADDMTEFLDELTEHRAPINPDIDALPNRLIL